MSTCQHRQISRHFDVRFWCNFDGRTIGVILMYIFDIVSMNRKSTQLQRASFDVVWKGKKGKNRGYLSAPYWQVFDKLKMRVVRPSLFNVISFQCTDILWKFQRNDQMKRPVLVTCKFMKTFMRVFPFL